MAAAGATATTQVQLPFVPREHQREAHALRLVFRFLVLVWHRRAGKTVFAVMELILAALAFKGEGGRFAYICPLLKQSKEVAWDYVKRFARVIPGCSINESELSVTFAHNGARVRLYGGDNPDGIRGGYFDGVVLDEVGQIKRDLWLEVIRPMLADRGGWAIFLGTPKGVNLFSELYFDAQAGVGLCAEKKADGTPNWAASLKRWHETNAVPREEIEASRASMPPQLFAQEWDCDFFAAQENVLIPLELAQAAMKRDLKADAFRWAATVLGVDVARKGDDYSAIAKRQGRVAFRIEKHRIPDTMALAARVAWVAEREKPQAVFVDVTGGLGAGVLDRLQQLQLGCPVLPADFGSAADEPKFKNRRAEMWWRMAEWMKDGCIPEDHELAQELVAATYDYDASGRLFLHDKDEMKERLGRSPDKADALCTTFHTAIAPPQHLGLHGPAGLQGGRSIVTEYDPYRVEA